MADNIVLPAVPVLREIDDSTKLLIEQAGEINRYPISDLDIGGGDVTIDLNSPGGDSTNTGNPINADTLGGYPAEDYAKLSDLEHLDTSGVSMELLWENASPASSFDEQDITFEKCDADAYIIRFKYSASQNMDFSEVVVPGMLAIVSRSTTFNGRAGGAVYTRDVEISESKDATTVHFSAGRTQNGTVETTSNSTSIPIEIYGIKGVSV